MQGGPGNDLLISSQICEGDEIFGDVKGKGNAGVDNAQFHPEEKVGVFADLEKDHLGEVGTSEDKCNGERYETLSEIEDLEGSPQGDLFRADNEPNLLIGRGGVDELFAKGGNDVINAKDGAIDKRIDCGGPQSGDEAHVDLSVNGQSEADVSGVVTHCGDHVNGKGPAFISDVPGAEDEPEPPALAGPSSTPRPQLTTQLPLDESAGIAAANLIEGGADGTYEAAGVGPSVNGPGPTLGVPGALHEDDPAVKLDGSGAFIDLAGQGGPGESKTGAYSVSLFVKFSRPPGEREYLFSNAEGVEGTFLYRNSEGKLIFETTTEAGSAQVSSAEAIKDESWHQVIGILEGETITLNLDGFPYRLGYGQSVLPRELNSPNSLIGAGPGRVDFLAASVDQFASYEGVISESEAFARLSESRAEEPELLLAPPVETTDSDGDGIPDGIDNCPEVSNSDQADANGDGIGDACEPPDSDGDGIPDATDNCPHTYNPEQTDSNSDGIGDECALLPPTVTTEAPSSLKARSAFARSTVNPGGLPTTYQFEYGTTTAYGSFSPVSPRSIGSGTVPLGTAEERLVGLQPGTTYHYRVIATNEAGEAEGADETFTTPKLPTATTEAASAVKAATATLNAMVNPGGSETSYQFEYGTTTAYGAKAPVSPKAIGSGTVGVALSEAIGGLEPNTTYHYRVVATSEPEVIRGLDSTFTTEAGPVSAAQLGAMAVSEPFNGSASSTADFSANFSALGWASGTPAKGEDSTVGWHPSPAFPTLNGAFYAPTLTDTGSGVAAEATMATNPSIEERHFSLWLDMPTPASTRAGYELRFTETAANTYTVVLAKWQGGVQTVLASQAGFAFQNGSSFAIVDQGSKVSAWTNTGSGFIQLLGAEDATFSSGNAGLEGAGNITRLTNFKAGVPRSGVANMDAALKGLSLNDAFAINESPLSGAGAWGALAWDNSTAGTNTGHVEGGWGPSDAFSTVNGAFWQKANLFDTGSGDAVAATLAHNPNNPERYFSLWLDMPTPASAKSGYELRFTETSPNLYEVALSEWQAGTKTVLASKAGFALPNGSQVALVEKGGTASAWTNAGSEFTQLLSASDSSFNSGFTGVEGSGNFTRMTNFKSGLLAPF
jgi:hypothetical protein